MELCQTRRGGRIVKIWEIEWTLGKKYRDISGDENSMVWTVWNGELSNSSGEKIQEIYCLEQLLTNVEFVEVIEWKNVPKNARIWVSNDLNEWQKAHFAGHSPNTILAYPYGRSEWTSGAILDEWLYAKLADDEDEEEE